MKKYKFHEITPPPAVFRVLKNARWYRKLGKRYRINIDVGRKNAYEKEDVLYCIDNKTMLVVIERIGKTIIAESLIRWHNHPPCIKAGSKIMGLAATHKTGVLEQYENTND